MSSWMSITETRANLNKKDLLGLFLVFMFNTRLLAKTAAARLMQSFKLQYTYKNLIFCIIYKSPKTAKTAVAIKLPWQCVFSAMKADDSAALRLPHKIPLPYLPNITPITYALCSTQNSKALILKSHSIALLLVKYCAQQAQEIFRLSFGPNIIWAKQCAWEKHHSQH